jgi:hypothetical protein
MTRKGKNDCPTVLYSTVIRFLYTYPVNRVSGALRWGGAFIEWNLEFWMRDQPPQDASCGAEETGGPYPLLSMDPTSICAVLKSAIVNRMPISSLKFLAVIGIDNRQSLFLGGLCHGRRRKRHRFHFSTETPDEVMANHALKGGVMRLDAENFRSSPDPRRRCSTRPGNRGTSRS